MSDAAGDKPVPSCPECKRLAVDAWDGLCSWCHAALDPEEEREFRALHEEANRLLCRLRKGLAEHVEDLERLATVDGRIDELAARLHDEGPPGPSSENVRELAAAVRQFVGPEAT